MGPVLHILIGDFSNIVFAARLVYQADGQVVISAHLLFSKFPKSRFHLIIREFATLGTIAERFSHEETVQLMAEIF